MLSHEDVEILFLEYPELNELYKTGVKLIKASKPLMTIGIVGSSVATASQVLGIGYGTLVGVLCSPLIPVSVIFKIAGGNKVSGAAVGYNEYHINP